MTPYRGEGIRQKLGWEKVCGTEGSGVWGPSGVNLNQYAVCGSFIRWHSDNEPLFGKREDPKVIVCMSLGSLVVFRRSLSDSV